MWEVALSIAADNIAYWNKRAESYSEINRSQLDDERKVAWLEALEEPLNWAFPKHEPHNLRILDIGCGPGLFSILLARQGYRVTAADYTPNMLAEARQNAEIYGSVIEFVEADAQDLPFADESFDAIVTRNLTWDLPNPCQAYAEWNRVLSSGGVIVNFDANWYRYLFDEDAKEAYEQDRVRTQESGMREDCEIPGYEKMERIARDMPLSPINRPAWDIAYLGELGMEARADTEVWHRIWNAEEQVNFASTPQFCIIARKR